jgi:hypothetical protein
MIYRKDDPSTHPDPDSVIILYETVYCNSNDQIEDGTQWKYAGPRFKVGDPVIINLYGKEFKGKVHNNCVTVETDGGLLITMNESCIRRQ